MHRRCGVAAGAAAAGGALLGVLMMVTMVEAQPVAARRVVGPGGAVGAGGVVSLPYTMSDNRGTNWLIYQYGQFQQQGNMPVYSQGGMLQINNQYPQSRNNQARVDEKTGEVVLENMPVGNVLLTRRILVDKEERFVRYIDVIKNTQNAEQSVNLSLMANTNYGVQMATTVADPRKKDQNLAWVAQTHGNGQCVVEMYAGKGAKVAPTIQYQQGNNQVQAFLTPKIPAGKEIALMHFHALVPTIEAGSKFVTEMKESKIMSGIPPALRRMIINFRGGENFIGDYEILRGDVLDVVELRPGDQLKGTLQEKSFRLETFYGPVELPVESVIGLINVGQFRPRQLVVTKDGEIFGGKLSREKIGLTLSSGQVTEIPVSQISRVGYRKRSGEAEEWTFEKPFVLMRTGDRMNIQMPSQEIPVVTRYGSMKLRPEAVAAITFQAEEHGVHDVQLTDGSRFAGLVSAEVFEVKLAAAASGGGAAQTVKIPSSSIRRLQLGRPVEADEEQATMKLSNEDVLVGTLGGGMKLDTAFSTITLSGGEVKRLAHTAGSPTDVQVTLWDETTVSGQLQDQEIACHLNSGVTIRVPVALVEEYTQPRPVASGQVLDVIKGLVAELNAEDQKQRDAAQERLVAMGPVVITTLQQLRGQQTPEGQNRIDAVLKQLDAKPGEAPAAAAEGAATRPQAPAVRVE